jgi:hypothetical protein
VPSQFVADDSFSATSAPAGVLRSSHGILLLEFVAEKGV